MAKTVDLLISLNQRYLVQRMRGDEAYDMAEAIGRVPTARIVNGDSKTSVRVTVEAAHVDELEKELREVAVVEPYRELAVF